VRRRGILAAATVAAVPWKRTVAQDFPSRPVRTLVPFGAGGISDLVARLVAEVAGPIPGQPIVVENRTGAGGNIAAEAAARAQPNGHTVLFCSIGMLAAAHCAQSATGLTAELALKASEAGN
jgi:tripartite-type tricarboxylate transporter receptor subunit TctC